MGRAKRAGRQLRALRNFVDAAVRDPEFVREIVYGLLGRDVGASANLGDYNPPAGLAEFTKTAHANQVLEYPAKTVLAFVADLSRIPDWLDFHNGWRGEAPRGAYEGLEFGEKVLVMGIPADLAWTVAEVTDSTLGLRGSGPMGLVLALWVTVEDNGDTSILHADAGISGQPVNGPMAASILRNLGDAMSQSLAALPAALAAAGRLDDRPARKPVLHSASGRLLAATTPVLVGAGQVVVRKPVAPYRDPSALAVEALRKAGTDSGAGDALLRAADAVYAVASASWQYRDLAALVGAAVGASPSETVQSSPFGGDGAQLLLNEAATAIAGGRHEASC